MKPIRDHFEQQQAPVAGIAKDLRRLKTEGAASVDELRQFVGQLKGRSPQEVMGEVAQSDLVRSIVLAAAGCMVLLVVLTIFPYWFRDRSSSATTAQPATELDTTSRVPVAVTNETTSPATASGTGQPDLKRAADVMGIGDAAPADSDPERLNDRLEKLLDGID